MNQTKPNDVFAMREPATRFLHSLRKTRFVLGKRQKIKSVMYFFRDLCTAKLAFFAGGSSQYLNCETVPRGLNRHPLPWLSTKTRSPATDSSPEGVENAG